MPLFEYKCNECGEKFEEFRSASAEEPVACPRCQSLNTSKMFSTFASAGSGSGSVVSSGSNCGPGSFT